MQTVWLFVNFFVFVPPGLNFQSLPMDLRGTGPLNPLELFEPNRTSKVNLVLRFGNVSVPPTKRLTPGDVSKPPNIEVTQSTGKLMVALVAADVNSSSGDRASSLLWLTFLRPDGKMEHPSPLVYVSPEVGKSYVAMAFSVPEGFSMADQKFINTTQRVIQLEKVELGLVAATSFKIHGVNEIEPGIENRMDHLQSLLQNREGRRAGAPNNMRDVHVDYQYWSLNLVWAKPFTDRVVGDIVYYKDEKVVIENHVQMILDMCNLYGLFVHMHSIKRDASGGQLVELYMAAVYDFHRDLNTEVGDGEWIGFVEDKLDGTMVDGFALKKTGTHKKIEMTGTEERTIFEVSEDCITLCQQDIGIKFGYCLTEHPSQPENNLRKSTEEPCVIYHCISPKDDLPTHGPIEFQAKLHWMLPWQKDFAKGKPEAPTRRKFYLHHFQIAFRRALLDNRNYSSFADIKNLTQHKRGTRLGNTTDVTLEIILMNSKLTRGALKTKLRNVLQTTTVLAYQIEVESLEIYNGGPKEPHPRICGLPRKKDKKPDTDCEGDPDIDDTCHVLCGEQVGWRICRTGKDEHRDLCVQERCHVLPTKVKPCPSGHWVEFDRTCVDECSKTCGTGFCRMRRRCMRDGIFVRDAECGMREDAFKYLVCNNWPCDKGCNWDGRYYGRHVSNIRRDSHEKSWSYTEECSCGCRKDNCQEGKNITIQVDLVNSQNKSGNFDDKMLEYEELSKAGQELLNKTIYRLFEKWVNMAKEQYPAGFNRSSFDLALVKGSIQFKTQTRNANIYIGRNRSNKFELKLIAASGVVNFLTHGNVTAHREYTAEVSRNITRIIRDYEPLELKVLNDDPNTAVIFGNDSAQFETKKKAKIGIKLYKHLRNYDNDSAFSLMVSDCHYCAQWRWPHGSKEIYFRVSGKVEGKKQRWVGIGFSDGTNMDDEVDAIFAYYYDSPINAFVREALIVGHNYHADLYNNWPARRGHINMTEDGFISFSFSKLVGKFAKHDITQLKPLNLIFPVSGGRADPKPGFSNGFAKFGVIKHDDTPIVAENIIIHECMPYRTPVHGEWSPWSHWSTCDRSCGDSYRSRKRTCDAPPPAFDGNECEGNKVEKMFCENQPDCVDCPDTVENVYWYPHECFDKKKFAATNCDYIVTWEYKLHDDYVRFVVKSKGLDHWTGLGISYGDPMTGRDKDGKITPLLMIIGYINQAKADNMEGFIAKYWFENGFNTFWDGTGKARNQLLEIDDEFIEYKHLDRQHLIGANEGFMVRKVDINGTVMLEMRFRLEAVVHREEGEDMKPGQLMITRPEGVNFLYPISGGSLPRNSSQKFHVYGMVQNIPPNIESLRIRQCLGKYGLEIHGGELTCYFCTDNVCKHSEVFWPGHKYRCLPGVLTCQKFIGYIQGRRHLLRMCGSLDDPVQDRCVSGRTRLQSTGQIVDGVLCKCDRSLCNISTVVRSNFFFASIMAGLMHFFAM